MQHKVIVSAVGLILAIGGHATHQQTAFADVSFYDRVVEQAFESVGADRLSRQPVWTLRFLQSEAGELQLKLREDVGNERLHVERWRIPPGTPTLWRQVSDLVAKSPGITTDDAAREVRVEHTSGTVPITNRLRKLLQLGAELAIDVPISNTITLDGTKYGLKVASLAGTLDFEVDGPQDGFQSSEQVIHWMAEMRGVLQAAPLQADK